MCSVRSSRGRREVLPVLLPVSTGSRGGATPVTVARSQNANKNACDRLFSQLVRSRGVCQYPGCERHDVVCAHIIGRRFAKVRTNELNAWALCPTHHYAVDNWPEEKMWLVARTIGLDAYAELRAQAESIATRFDWKSERERLKALNPAVSPQRTTR